jgi:DNA-binding Lrp family transcriptional regulator
LTEEQMKILKLMSEMTSRVDMNEFSKKMDLDPTKMMEQMQDLAKQGYLRKVGRGFAVTAKGKAALKAAVQVPSNMRFHFYIAISQPTGSSAGSIKEFYDLISTTNAASLEFHVRRGDFESWFRNAMGEGDFANALGKLKNSDLVGEDLRKSLLKEVKAKYNL